jgi:hypothetical protein
MKTYKFQKRIQKTDHSCVPLKQDKVLKKNGRPALVTQLAWALKSDTSWRTKNSALEEHVGWGSIFRKTPDTGLASYSIIPVRGLLSMFVDVRLPSY